MIFSHQYVHDPSHHLSWKAEAIFLRGLEEFTDRCQHGWHSPLPMPVIRDTRSVSVRRTPKTETAVMVRYSACQAPNRGLRQADAHQTLPPFPSTPDRRTLCFFEYTNQCPDFTNVKTSQDVHICVTRRGGAHVPHMIYASASVYRSRSSRADKTARLGCRSGHSRMKSRPGGESCPNMDKVLALATSRP